MNWMNGLVQAGPGWLEWSAMLADCLRGKKSAGGKDEKLKITNCEKKIQTRIEE